jgi:hypothetical protein
MTIGAHVIVVAAWSSFHGQRGVVVGTKPLMVRLFGERLPMRFGEREVAPVSVPEHVGGAE